MLKKNLYAPGPLRSTLQLFHENSGAGVILTAERAQRSRGLFLQSSLALGCASPAEDQVGGGGGPAEYFCN